CQTLSASIPDNVSREDFLRTISAPGNLRGRGAPRASGRTATQVRPGTQARAPGTQFRPPTPQGRGTPSRPTPAVEHPPSPMPRAPPWRPVRVQTPPSPPRGSPSRPTPVVEPPPPRARALVEDDLHRAEQALAIALGPVARALVKRAARSANTPWELFASLA